MLLSVHRSVSPASTEDTRVSSVEFEPEDTRVSSVEFEPEDTRVSSVEFESEDTRVSCTDSLSGFHSDQVSERPAKYRARSGLSLMRT